MVSVMSDEPDLVGLCARCEHAEVVPSAKGSTFYRCRLSVTDERFPRYPVLPVLRCVGHTPPADPGSPLE
jgi:hypothetical protein